MFEFFKKKMKEKVETVFMPDYKAVETFTKNIIEASKLDENKCETYKNSTFDVWFLLEEDDYRLWGFEEPTVLIIFASNFGQYRISYNIDEVDKNVLVENYYNNLLKPKLEFVNAQMKCEEKPTYTGGNEYDMPAIDVYIFLLDKYKIFPLTNSFDCSLIRPGIITEAFENKIITEEQRDELYNLVWAIYKEKREQK